METYQSAFFDHITLNKQAKLILGILRHGDAIITINHFLFILKKMVGRFSNVNNM